MKSFVISDTHFLHKNIIKYANRPFTSINEMDIQLINNWNSIVSNEDIIYHLGDFGIDNKTRLEEIFNSLNGKKILIEGNHDRRSKVCKFNWKEIHKLHTISYKNQLFILCHYPLMSWDRQHYGSIHLYGHIHNHDPLIKLKNAYNVSVEQINYKPISLDKFIGDKENEFL